MLKVKLESAAAMLLSLFELIQVLLGILLVCVCVRVVSYLEHKAAKRSLTLIPVSFMYYLTTQLCFSLVLVTCLFRFLGLQQYTAWGILSPVVCGH